MSSIVYLTEDILEQQGFEYENDNGHECDWRKGNILICQYGDKFVHDRTGYHITTQNELVSIINEQLLIDAKERLNRLKTYSRVLKTP